jgi:hypothetical protein
MHCEDTMILNNSTKRPYNTVIDADILIDVDRMALASADANVAN